MASTAVSGPVDLRPFFGRLFLAVRTKSGLSQREAADRCKVGRQWLSRVENGHTLPGVEKVVRCAAGYGVPIMELLETPEEIKLNQFMSDLEAAGVMGLTRRDQVILITQLQICSVRSKATSASS